MKLNMKSGILRRFLSLPFENYGPGDDLQDQCHASQNTDCHNVPCPPFLVNCQYVQAFEDIDDAKDDHSVSNGVMVDVPVESVFVILVWPQKQCKNLKNTQVRVVRLHGKNLK